MKLDFLDTPKGVRAVLVVYQLDRRAALIVRKGKRRIEMGIDYQKYVGMQVGGMAFLKGAIHGAFRSALKEMEGVRGREQ